MAKLLLIVAASLLAGCATIARHEHASLLKQANRDDQACRDQGWHYPEPRYVTCRMQLDDKRQYRNWMNLQVMRQSQYQNPSAVPAAVPRESYRPLDRGHYHCRYVTEKDQDYILCGETPRN